MAGIEQLEIHSKVRHAFPGSRSEGEGEGETEMLTSGHSRTSSAG